MKYYKMLHQDGEFANIPSSEFVKLLEYKLKYLKRVKLDSSWDYGIKELEQEIKTVKEWIKEYPDLA